MTKKPAKTDRERRRRRAAAVKRYSKTPRARYQQHKQNARRRGVSFLLTFDEWLDVWKSSGHFDERGNQTAHGFVMARKGDRGAYALGNVEVVPHRVNVAERNRNFAYAKRAGVPYDWYLNGPPESEPIDASECPF